MAKTDSHPTRHSARRRPSGNTGRPSIFVIGPEGSGTTLAWRCLAAHPELRGMTAIVAPERDRPLAATGVLMHVSLPTRRPMIWVEPEDLPDDAKVVVVRRSPVHTVYSAYRRFHEDPAEAWRTYFRAAELEQRYISLHTPYCVQYEALVAAPANVLRGIYEWIGVGGRFEPRIQIHSRNDERWRDDATFAEFMRQAFGEIEAPPASRRQTSIKKPRQRPAAAPRAADGGGTAARLAVPAYPRLAGHGPPRVMPARFVRIDDVLTPEEHARLLEYACAREAGFQAASVILADGRFETDSDYRRAATIGDLADVWGMLDARLRPLLPYVRHELELAWFPLGRVERQIAVHGHGDFFRPHADSTDPAVADRCVTCVYYFHGRPKRFTGGELRLYDTLIRGARSERGEKYVSVDPSANTAIFFASDLYHAVGPVHRESAAFADSRFSVNVWFCTQEPGSSGEAVRSPRAVRARGSDPVTSDA